VGPSAGTTRVVEHRSDEGPPILTDAAYLTGPNGSRPFCDDVLGKHLRESL
jgi:hypothetical protein